ncbi:MAG: hypothetical protein K0Q79_2661 [Flavipsychrobacter sp.]|nr:hypothetical protein [Flavipsychrobacter sp.]
MHKFKAPIKIIGINPYVDVPEKILKDIFKKAGRDKGKFPICGEVNGKPYKQTLVKYSGEWRLYINTIMLKNSPKRIGEIIEITVQTDTSDRTVKPHPKFAKALAASKEAKAVFDKLSPSRRNEIVRYIANLKTEESVERNVNRAISYLLGKDRFVGMSKLN